MLGQIFDRSLIFWDYLSNLNFHIPLCELELFFFPCFSLLQLFLQALKLSMYTRYRSLVIVQILLIKLLVLGLLLLLSLLQRLILRHKMIQSIFHIHLLAPHRGSLTSYELQVDVISLMQLFLKLLVPINWQYQGLLCGLEVLMQLFELLGEPYQRLW